MEDHAIVRQVLAGNVKAFKFLVLRYQKPIFRYIRSFGLSDAQVEDISQDVFVSSYKSLAQYNPAKSGFSTWLFVIAKNKALNAVKKHSYVYEDLVDIDPDISDKDTPLASLERENLNSYMHQSINELPLQFRNVLTLFHFNEMSLEEISEIEKCGIGTVKSRLHRAKNMLKELIIKKYGEESL